MILCLKDTGALDKCHLQGVTPCWELETSFPLTRLLDPLKPILRTCYNPSKMSPNESLLHSLDLLNISFPREESLLSCEQLMNYTFFKNYIFV